jgi:hypothetical protein
MHAASAACVMLLTVGRRSDPQNARSAWMCASRLSVMSMTQLVIGAALGFLIAQGVLHGLRFLLGCLQREAVRGWLRNLSAAPGRAILATVVRYAAPLGVSAALITLAVWAVGDYFAARSARNVALASVLKPPPAAALPGVPGASGATAASAAKQTPPTTAAASADPYADADFKVRRRVQRPGATLSLKDALLQRSEARARAELLGETRQNQHRSQYDCETADRAEKYLRAGLDVWGFAAWQLKYFPADAYKGATLPQCKDIKDVVAPSLDVRSSVANRAPEKPS